ncbi:MULTISPECIES: alpha/beta fold hydrolase [unclassified Burkholderia]|uniref:alpha/beta fold hydrolase n=1 Tax=unclassified Burkholderia TaxID=2613784 RepID=UPI000F55EE38|nr:MULTISPECIES: alpha/beta hydrolase [unclassified Burkholderia]RQR88763.1 alpha/beta fold hydrolase [Burkholderia sp. Bp9011]RQR97926.1 alpha/beta fold hydrolase [Burkholderia sp. Bp9010]RQS12706.1 alpha/beta fold hydrolase [Burkholderia sp. Bp8991]RQS81457.1 alpha/beta fold hydrolase [Burkholderia sp. Bp8977]
MSQPAPPVVFVHGFIGTFDVPAWPGPHLAPDLLGYGVHRDTPFDAITLAAQVEHLRQAVDTHYGAQPVDLVGHSVGGAIAMLFAHAHPARVRRIVNVEGNFTLDDAFWSASVGRMSPAQADAMLDGLRSDPSGWLRGAIDEPSPRQLDDARRWLAHQPASTLRAMGRSVVATTGEPGYLQLLAEVFERHPVRLVAGDRSRAGWHVPDWALARCAGFETIAGCGHLIPAERPAAFREALARCLG